MRSNRILALTLVAMPLAGCVTGQAEYRAQGGGKVPQATLERARAVCRMRVRDTETAQLAAGQAPEVNGTIDDARDCFTAQGIELTGFRQKDGTLTRYPHEHSTKAQ